MRTHIIGFCVIVGLIVVGGCARQQTVHTPDGKVKVTDKAGKGQSVEVETDTGSVKMSTEKRSITEAELGLPVYPGAVVDATSEYESHEEGEQSGTHVILSTKDSFDKVYAFYKANLKNVTQQVKQTMGDNQVAMFGTKRADGAPISLTITTDNEEQLTRIQVMQVGEAP